MTEKILLVEDDPMIGEAVVNALADAGKAADWARSGWEATGFLSENKYDAVLLDLGLPGKDGMSVLRELRAKDSETPVVILTARDGLDDRLAGLDAGADDYVVKPFSPKELMARVKAVLNRHHATAEQVSDQRLKFEGLEIDLAGREVYVDGQRATMTPKEYDLLFYLVKNKGLALSRDKLLEAVWGYDFFGDDRTVDTHIKMLRGSLGGYRKFIVTLRGMGYKFDPDA